MAAEHAQGRRVRRIRLEIGKLTCVAPTLYGFASTLRRRKHRSTASRLEIVEIEAQARCRACGETFVQETLWASCQCGAQDCQRLSGDELRVKEYELDADVTV